MNNWQLNIQDFTTVVEGLDDIQQSIYLILSTVKGSDPLRPQFGCDLYRYIDKPLYENKPMLVYCIMDAIEKWDKRFQAKRCEVTSKELGSFQITLHGKLTANGEQKTITVNI